MKYHIIKTGNHFEVERKTIFGWKICGMPGFCNDGVSR